MVRGNCLISLKSVSIDSVSTWPQVTFTCQLGTFILFPLVLLYGEDYRYTMSRLTHIKLFKSHANTNILPGETIHALIMILIIIIYNINKISIGCVNM